VTFSSFDRSVFCGVTGWTKNAAPVPDGGEGASRAADNGGGVKGRWLVLQDLAGLSNRGRALPRHLNSQADPKLGRAGMSDDEQKALIQRIRKRCDVARGGCWTWALCTDRDGYALIRYGGRTRRAHRLMAIAAGILPEDAPPSLLACHRCDNPACCRPGHLFAGTSLDNKRDCMTKGRLGATLNAEKVRAIRGDPRRHRLIAAHYGISAGHVSAIKVEAVWFL
jgi:HNH endonuclease